MIDDDDEVRICERAEKSEEGGMSGGRLRGSDEVMGCCNGCVRVLEGVKV